MLSWYTFFERENVFAGNLFVLLMDDASKRP